MGGWLGWVELMVGLVGLVVGTKWWHNFHFLVGTKGGKRCPSRWAQKAVIFK